MRQFLLIKLYYRTLVGKKYDIRNGLYYKSCQDTGEGDNGFILVLEQNKTALNVNRFLNGIKKALFIFF